MRREATLINPALADRLDLSVVIPVCDERENLVPLVDELLEVLASLRLSFEIILVDDGSRDGSGQVISTLASRKIGVRGLGFRDNQGQTAALDAGFRVARGAVIVTSDADLQYDPQDIPRLLEALDGNSAAVGYRGDRRDSWFRRIQSNTANWIRNRLSGDDIIDTGCSLKAFRRESLRRIKMFHGMHRFLPTLVRLEGGTVTQIPVRHRARRSGNSKYGMGNRAFRAFADLLAVRWMKKRRLGYEVIRDDS